MTIFLIAMRSVFAENSIEAALKNASCNQLIENMDFIQNCYSDEPNPSLIRKSCRSLKPIPIQTVDSKDDGSEKLRRIQNRMTALNCVGSGPVCVYPTLGEIPEVCEDVLTAVEEQVSNDPELGYCYESIARAREIHACRVELESGPFAQACREAALNENETSIASIDEEMATHNAMISMNCMYLIQVHPETTDTRNDQ